MGVGKNLRDALASFFAQEQAASVKETARGWNLSTARVMGMPDSYPNLGYDYSIPLFDDTLLARFARYEEMDTYPLSSLVLDTYADDCTVYDAIRNHIIWGQSKDKAVEGLLNDLRDDLHMEDDAWVHARTTGKYGNTYGEILGRPGDGVMGINYLPTATVRRVENRHGLLLGYFQVEAARISTVTINPDDFVTMLAQAKNSGALDRPLQPYDPMTYGQLGNVILFEPGQIVHWRMRRDLRSVYGLGILETADYVWRRLRMLEDAVLVHKLTRAPGRYAFYINAHKLPPEQAFAYVQKLKNAYKKRRFINPRTGQLDARFNPLAADEDFWIPIIGGEEESRIETISGPDYQGMEEVEYFLKQFYVATKVPRQYMDFAETMNKALLSSEDVRFARAVMRLQQAEVTGWNQLGRTHLHLLGYDLDKTEKFAYHMPIPSAIFELAMVEVMAAKADLASRLSEFVSVRWILQHIFKWADDEIDTVFDQWAEEKVWKTIVEAIGNAEGAKIQGEAEVENQRKQAELAAEMGGGEEGEESRNLPASAKQMIMAAKEAKDQRRNNNRNVKASFGLMDKNDQMGFLTLGEELQKNIRRILEEGNKESEKRMEGRLQGLLLNHHDKIGARFRMLIPFMNEMRSAIRYKQGRGSD